MKVIRLESDLENIMEVKIDKDFKYNTNEHLRNCLLDWFGFDRQTVLKSVIAIEEL